MHVDLQQRLFLDNEKQKPWREKVCVENSLVLSWQESKDLLC